MKPSIVRSLYAVLCASAALFSHAAEPGVLARVGDTDVNVEDIRAALENLDPREQAALARDPALLNQAVRSLLARRVVLKEALAKKWDQNPSVITQLQRARENALIESYLQSVTTPPSGWPSDDELRTVYEANKAALLAPRQWRLEQIFIAQPKGAEAAAVDKANAKLTALRKALAQPGADFGSIMRTQSDGPVRTEEAAWVADNQLRPDIRSIVAGLSPQAVSEPVQLDDGWHILKVLEIKEPATLTLDEVRGPLAQRVRAERTQANRQAYLAKLMEQNPVSINEIALSSALPAPVR